MDDCAFVEEQILAFLESALASADMTRIASHAASCRACHVEIASLQLTVRRLESIETPPLSASFEDRVMRALAGEERPLRAWWSSLAALVQRPLVLASAVALVLVAVLVWPGRPGDGESLAALAGSTLAVGAGQASVNGESVAAGSLRPLREGDSIEVGSGFEGSLAFDDGSRVKLAEGTRLEVYRRSLRVAHGDVWLRVTRGAEGFEVHTPVAVAAVRGTRFGVRHDGSTEVEVTEGSVEVSSDVATRLLGAGQAVRVEPTGELKGLEARRVHEIFDMDDSDFERSR